MPSYLRTQNFIESEHTIKLGQLGDKTQEMKEWFSNYFPVISTSAILIVKYTEFYRVIELWSQVHFANYVRDANCWVSLFDRKWFISEREGTHPILTQFPCAEFQSFFNEIVADIEFWERKLTVGRHEVSQIGVLLCWVPDSVWTNLWEQKLCKKKRLWVRPGYGLRTL